VLPIILHHGLFGFGQIKLGPVRISYFHKIDRAIENRDWPVMLAQVHPSAAIATRAASLAKQTLKQLDKVWKAPRCIIVAHSMGGLDARFMISKLGLADRVAALLTICTPHRGSSYADWAMKRVVNHLDRMKVMKMLRLDISAVADLTVERCAQFNIDVPDAPGVRYYSIACVPPVSRLPIYARHAHRIIFAAEGDNDSQVSLASARWGEFLGTWPVGHAQAINSNIARRRGTPAIDVAPLYIEALNRIAKDLGVDRQL
jgi:triacylglycerol lipase